MQERNVKYRISLETLLESVEYCSDVESDGYYMVKETNEIIKHGEDLSEDLDDETYDYVTSDKCFQLPTYHDLHNEYPDWSQKLPEKFIAERISDEKQKKQLRKALKSLFGNKMIAGFPGSTKFVKVLSELGRMEEWNQYVREDYRTIQIEFLNSWCDKKGVKIYEEK